MMDTDGKTHKNINKPLENDSDIWNGYVNVMEWLFSKFSMVFMCLN